MLADSQNRPALRKNSIPQFPKLGSHFPENQLSYRSPTGFPGSVQGRPQSRQWLGRDCREFS